MSSDSTLLGLDPLVQRLGVLCGIIKKDDEEDVLNTDWFADPLQEPPDGVPSLRTIPTNEAQRNALVELLEEMWPKDKVGTSPILDSDGKAEKTLTWLEVPRSEKPKKSAKSSGDEKEPKGEKGKEGKKGEEGDKPPASFFVVTQKTAKAVSLGAGLIYRYEPGEKKEKGADKEKGQTRLSQKVGRKAVSQLTIDSFTYLPLAGMPADDDQYFVLGTDPHPLYLGVDVHIKDDSLLDKMPEKLAAYDGLRLIWGFVFQDGPEAPSFQAFARKKKKGEDEEAEFELIVGPDFELFLRFLLTLAEIQAWLNLSPPDRPNLSLLELLKKLIPEFSLPDLSLPDISLPELPDFPEIDFSALLQALLDLKLPSFELPGLPEISINLDKTICVEFQFQDIRISTGSTSAKRKVAAKQKADAEQKSAAKKKPYEVQLQLGKALGAEDENNWVGAKPGIKVCLSEPSLELKSIGLDIEGAAAAPLVDVKGVRLEGVKPRFYLLVDKEGVQAWGVASDFQKVSIPLGPPAGKGGGGNPVAQNLLSSGGKGDADPEPVNPTFSATVGYRDEIVEEKNGLFGEIEGDESSDGKVWLAVQRAFGPLFCRRIGFGFEPDETRLLVGYDGKVSVGPMGLNLVDLSIGIPLKNPTEIENYSLDLGGIDISFDQEPIGISGGLFKLEDPETGLTEYAGSAVISAKALTISGFGVFGSVEGDISFFLFAMLDKDLGGPAFFHVTGLAAGFGYNRGLKLPAIEEVEEFPLIKGVLEPGYLGQSDDPKEALVQLRDYLPARRGAYWFAVGVRFTSFEVIESVALLSASFGTQTVISLLGVSTLAVPMGAKKGEAVAYARLMLKAELVPDAGSLKIDGQLTDDSYILSEDCRLTGGFAFYSWFAGEHDGDFVITVGGYHPRFDRPPHYPIVRRVGIFWPVTGDLMVRGELYFALTPSCLMAGGKLEARFESGGLKAWFDAYADFIMYWEPFRYEIDVGVRIGVSYTFSINLLFATVRITLKFELSAQLSLWGPSFAGRARLSWGPLDFTLEFGDQSQRVEPLEWGQFTERMLPPRPVTIDVVGGLIRQDKVALEAGKPPVAWPVVNAHELRITTRSTVPSTNISLGGMEVPTGSGASLGIWPMDQRTMGSSVTIEIKTYKGASVDAAFDGTVLRQGVPAAMWSPKPMAALTPSAEVIRDVATGLRFRLAEIDPTHTLPGVDLEKLKYEKIHKRIPWRADLQPPDPLAPASSEQSLKKTIWANSEVDTARGSILGALQEVTPYQLDAVDLQNLAETAETVYQAFPEPANLGQRPRRQ